MSAFAPLKHGSPDPSTAVPNDRLWQRLGELDCARETPQISARDYHEITRTLRAEGRSESEILDEMARRNAFLRPKGLPVIAEACDFELFEAVGADWAGSSRDRLVNLIGHLRKGRVCILGNPRDLRRSFDLPRSVDWRNLDLLTIDFLSRHVCRSPTWYEFWSRPTATGEDIVKYYIARAQASATFLLNEHPNGIDARRQRISERVQWIEEQRERPVSLPWQATSTDPA